VTFRPQADRLACRIASIADTVLPVTTPTIKISSPGDMVTAVARLLGYQPTNSVVIVSLRGNRRRFGLTLRYDLVVADHDPVGLVDQLAARVGLDSAREVFVIVYADQPPAAGEDLPYRELADLLEAKWRFPMRDMVYAAAGRWWSYLCDDRACCPPEGTAIDVESPAIAALAAEHAFVGQAMLADRDAVVESVAADEDEGADDRSEAIETAVISGVAVALDARRHRVRELIDALIARFADPRASVEDAEAVELAALMWHVIVRDEVLVQGADKERLEVLLRIFRQVVRRVPPPYDAPVCTMLSWFAYADGDGTMANIALDRALASDPEYSLATLIADGLLRQVPPSCLQQVMSGAAGDLKAGGAGEVEEASEAG
jgi:AcrR family transcriptional regulator